jgi:hypothetical protein
MRCPDCGASVRVATRVVIEHHPDGRWKVETPFVFAPSDKVQCSSFTWQDDSAPCDSRIERRQGRGQRHDQDGEQKAQALTYPTKTMATDV